MGMNIFGHIVCINLSLNKNCKHGYTNLYIRYISLIYFNILTYLTHEITVVDIETHDCSPGKEICNSKNL